MTAVDIPAPCSTNRRCGYALIASYVDHSHQSLSCMYLLCRLTFIDALRLQN